MQNSIRDTKKRNAASITEPCTLTEAKLKCIVDFTDDDALITSLITQCRGLVENKTFLSLVEKTIVLTVDLHRELKLPYGPIRQVTEVKWRQGTNSDGTPDYVTLTDDDFVTYGEDFLTIKSTKCGIHRISYSVGYTGTSGNYPTRDDLKNAVLEEVSYRYRNRGDETGPSICTGAMEYLKAYKGHAWV